MSFSKARIQRFNEQGNDVPPPGAYDPKFDNKVKGSVIEKSGRFQDNKSVASGSTECHLSLSSKDTGKGLTSSFRTPQVPNRRAGIKSGTSSCEKIKRKTPLFTKEAKVKCDCTAELADLKVECSNKDITIAEQEKHLEDLQEEIHKLVQQLEELHRNESAMVKQHKTDIEGITKLQQQMLTIQEEKYNVDIEALRTELAKITDAKEKEIAFRLEMQNEFEGRIREMSEKICALEIEVEAKGIQSDVLKKFQLLENVAEEKEYLEIQLNELKNEKESEMVRLTSTLNSKEEELLQVNKVNAELRDNLTNLEASQSEKVNLLTTKNCSLQKTLEELASTKNELELELNARQEVIVELQSQLKSLEGKLDVCKMEQEKFFIESEKNIKEITHKHQQQIITLKEEHKKDKASLLADICDANNLRSELEETIGNILNEKVALTDSLRDAETRYEDVVRQLQHTQIELNSLKEEYARIMETNKKEVEALKEFHAEEHAKLREVVENARENYLREIENISFARNQELVEIKDMSQKQIDDEKKRMKEYADKMIENAEAVTRETLAACRQESEERVKRVLAETDAKISFMVQEAKKDTEEEIRISAEKYAIRLERLESERKVLDEKLAERDVEVERLATALEELKKSAETQVSASHSLQAELDRAETELAQTKQELKVLKDQIRSEGAEMVLRKKRFEVIIAENQASVAALTRRLIQSDAEIERLQHELKCGEECIHEHRELLTAMRNNSQLVHEQVHVIMKQLDTKSILVEQLEANSVAEFASIKSVFDAKIEDLKEVSAKEINHLQEKYTKKSQYCDELKAQLDKMTADVEKAQAALVRLEEQSDWQATEIVRLQVTKEKWKTLMKEAEKELEELSMKLQVLEVEKLQQIRKKKNEMKSFESAILKELDAERSRREKAEAEVNSLKQSCDHLKKEYEDVTEKYTDIVGHQNHNQRVKHLEHLKKKIKHLEQELQVKTSIVEQQTKTIERLKSIKGKENFHATFQVSKSGQSTPASSPLKPHTPLRDRNE